MLLRSYYSGGGIGGFCVRPPMPANTTAGTPSRPLGCLPSQPRQHITPSMRWRAGGNLDLQSGGEVHQAMTCHQLL